MIDLKIAQDPSSHTPFLFAYAVMVAYIVIAAFGIAFTSQDKAVRRWFWVLHFFFFFHVLLVYSFSFSPFRFCFFLMSCSSYFLLLFIIHSFAHRSHVVCTCRASSCGC